MRTALSSLTAYMAGSLWQNPTARFGRLVPVQAARVERGLVAAASMQSSMGSAISELAERQSKGLACGYKRAHTTGV
jgi:hypothetical protein